MVDVLPFDYTDWRPSIIYKVFLKNPKIRENYDTLVSGERMNLRKLFYLPEIASAHGYEVDFIIYLIHFFMLILFIGWGIFFFIALFKFRKGKNPKNLTNIRGWLRHSKNVSII